MAVFRFFDIHDKDLPYGGWQNSRGIQSSVRSVTETVPFQLGQLANNREEGARLVADLTGVRDACKHYGNNVAGSQSHIRSQSTIQRKIHTENWLKRKLFPFQSKLRLENKRLFSKAEPAMVELGHKQDTVVHAARVEEPEMHGLCQSIREVVKYPPKVEKAVGTEDLSFWTNVAVVDKEPLKTCVFLDKESECSAEMSDDEVETSTKVAGQEQFVVGAEIVDKMSGLSYEEYMNRLKETMSFIRIRTQMLQELSLGDDMRSDSPALEGKKTPENYSKQDNATPFMSSTSIVVKHARRLAGLMHTEEQAIDLQDLYQWLQHLGKLVEENNETISTSKPFQRAMEALECGNVVTDGGHDLNAESRSTSFLPNALQKAQEDVQGRLAYLYQEKEEKLHNHFTKLQDMEDAYELLGASISDKLEEAERLEEEFQALQHDLEACGCPIPVYNKKRIKRSGQKHKGKVSNTDTVNSDTDVSHERHENDSSQSDESSVNSSGRTGNASQTGPVKELNMSHTNTEDMNGKEKHLMRTINTKDMQGRTQAAVHNSKKVQSSIHAERKYVKDKGQSLSSEDAKDVLMRDESQKRDIELKTLRKYKEQSLVSDGVMSHSSSLTPLNKKETSQTGPTQRTSSSAAGLPTIVDGESNNISSERDIKYQPFNHDKSEGDNGIVPEGIVQKVDTGRICLVSEVENVTKVDDRKQCLAQAESREANASLSNSDEVMRDAVNEPKEHRESFQEGLPNLQPDNACEEFCKEDKGTFRFGSSPRIDKEIKPSDSVSLQGSHELVTKEEKIKWRIQRLSRQDMVNQVVQTDDVAILTLDSYRDPIDSSGDSTDVQKLREDVRKLKKQLRFWRTKNWAEKHPAQPHIEPPTYSFFNQISKMEASSDVGLLFYYNPQTGFHTMINSSNLDINMQQSIMKVIDIRPPQGGQILHLPIEHGAANISTTPSSGISQSST